jgi:hypothetical protein
MGAGREAQVRLRLLGADRGVRGKGGQPLPGRINYLKGADPAAWRTGLSAYRTVSYPRIYPGIDLVYHGRQGMLEYDFQVAPGADPGRIRLSAGGGEPPRLRSDGALCIRTPLGEVVQRPPVAYQPGGGTPKPVDVRYVVNRTTAGEAHVSFRLGAYDRSAPLVIDPVLVYSHYLGGNGADTGQGVVLDPDGNAYVIGTTTSTDLVPRAGVQAERGGAADIFVMKLDPTGEKLIYATYLGGSSQDTGAGIALDAYRRAYFTGSTASRDFPVSPRSRPFGAELRGDRDAFVCRLSTDGSRLEYSFFYGGDRSDAGTGIGLDGAGNPHVSGYTESPDLLESPLKPELTSHQPRLNGARDGFAVRFDRDADRVTYATYLGAGGIDAASAIAVSSGGDAYVAINSGETRGTRTPKTGTGGSQDIRVVRLSPSGVSTYETLIGSSAYDEARAIALGKGEIVYLAGFTQSARFPENVPTGINPGPEPDDAFLCRLYPSGSKDTTVGRFVMSGNDHINALAVDGLGYVYLAGDTTSDTFSQEHSLHSYRGGTDAFVARVPAEETALSYSTLLGGSGEDSAHAIAVDKLGHAVVTGSTTSLDFPTAGAAPRPPGQDQEAFVTRLPVLQAGPEAPRELMAAQTTYASIDLTWIDQSNDEDGFEVERRSVSGNEPGPFQQLAKLPPNTARYSDTRLVSGTKYEYRVRALNSHGVSAYSLSKPLVAQTLPAPTGLIVGRDGGDPLLKWRYESDDEESFEVQRKSLDDTSGFVKVGTAPKSSEPEVMYRDKGAGTGPFLYRVRAVGSHGPSEFSNLASGPLQPASQTVTEVTFREIQEASVEVHWLAVGGDKLGYEVWRKQAATDPAVRVALVDSGTLSFPDKQLLPDTEYRYQVIILGPDGKRGATPRDAVVKTSVLIPPSNLQVTGTAVKARLRWINNSKAAALYEVERKQAGETMFSLIARLAPNRNSFEDRTVANTDYEYRVRAIRGDKPSVFSNTFHYKSP